MSKYIKQYESRVNALLKIIANLFNDGSITREQVNDLVEKVNVLCLFLQPAIQLANKDARKYLPKL
jgi:hypothetical protein